MYTIPENDKKLSMMNNKTISESYTSQRAAIKNSGAARSAYINFVYGSRDELLAKEIHWDTYKMLVDR